MKLSPTLTSIALIGISFSASLAEDFGTWKAPDERTRSSIGYTEWHSPDGRTISAAPINVIGNQVRIRLSDGREMNVSPSIFTPEDQKRMINWAIGNLAERDALIDISASRIKKKVNSTTKDVPLVGGGVKKDALHIDEFHAYYDMTIKNLSDLAIQSLEINYILYTEQEQAGSTREDAPIKTKKGSDKTSLDARGETLVRTDPIKMTETDLKGNVRYSSGADDESNAELIGIWLRIYYQGEVVKEYVNPPKLKKDFEWKH